MKTAQSVLLFLVLAGCGERAPPIECESAGDCGVDEACRDGTCGPLGEGEGEGEGEETDIFANVCQKFGACDLVDTAECVAQLTGQDRSLRAQGSDVCVQAADAHVTAYQCLMAVSCQQLQEGSWEQQCGAAFDEAGSLANVCNGSGEGEGEGEGEGCFEALALPEADADAPTLFIHVAELSPGLDELCGGTFAVGLVLEVGVSGLADLEGVASFDGETLTELFDVRVEDDFVVSAVACAEFAEPGGVAVQVVVDGLRTLPACASVLKPEEGP